MKAKCVVNGKMERDVKKLEGIQKLIGIRAKNVYGVKTEEELDAKMSDMDLIDLQRLAISSGISGGGSRMVLKSKIKNEFSKFSRGSHGLSLSQQSDMKLKGKNKKTRAQEVHDLLTEGF